MESPGHTLQTTALVNEAYLRLVDQSPGRLAGPDAFLRHRRAADAAHPAGPRPGTAAGQARRGRCHLPLDEGLVFSPAKSAALIALDEALTRLAEIDPRKAEVVELRYFGGMNVEETAEALQVLPTR